jgi:predicted  nucleic acid-binding Zn-ribbon protein
MVKHMSVTSPEMDNIMGRIRGADNRLDVLQENVDVLQENVNGLREEMSDVRNRLSALESKVDGLTEKLDNFIEIAIRYVQHHRPQFKTCSMQLLGVR